jgi:hypothetical protein
MKPISAKATEAEAAQSAVPPRATPAQLGFILARRAWAGRRFIHQTHPNAQSLLISPPLDEH